MMTTRTDAAESSRSRHRHAEVGAKARLLEYAVPLRQGARCVLGADADGGEARAAGGLRDLAPQRRDLLHGHDLARLEARRFRHAVQVDAEPRVALLHARLGVVTVVEHHDGEVLRL